MRAIGLLFRAAAFVFNLLLALGLFLLALVVLASGRHNIELAVVPAEGKTLTLTLLFASIYAFVAMALALRKGRSVRLPMLLWNLVVAVLLLWAPARPGFTFGGRDQFASGLYLLGAALIALAGSWLQWRAGGRTY